MLQECVEKLQRLSSREEYQRRLQEVPVVHSDPSMDRSCESEGIAREIDEKKQGFLYKFLEMEPFCLFPLSHSLLNFPLVNIDFWC